MSWRLRLRGWMMVWAVLQFALPTAASYADALLERAGIGARISHVESTAATSCPAAHPSDCALCQLVHRSDTPSATACVPLGDVHGVPARETLASIAVAGARGRLALPRAPPIV